jgi:hypothetical protein
MMGKANMVTITCWMRRFGSLALAAALVASTVWAGKTPPDAGGYTANNQAVYSFIDLTVSGGSASVLANQDDAVTLLTLPFPFTFYGNTYNLLCVSVNGLAYFVTASSACAAISDFQNVDLTVAATPGDLPALIPYWTDLLFQGDGAVYYQTQGATGSRKFVIQWNHAYPQATVLSANPVTFEVVLYETTNQVLFQYKTVNLGSANPASQGAQSTVGIRDTGGNSNGRETEWSYNSAVLIDSSALLFASSASSLPATQFLVSAPASVSLGTAFNFTVDALDQNNNLVTAYTGTVQFTSSDAQAVLPPPSTLTNGVGIFPATLKTLGSQTITAADLANSISKVSNVITVSYSLCDVKHNGDIAVADVQLIINQALGVSQPVYDLNTDGVVNVLDVQIEINAILGLGCATQ